MEGGILSRGHTWKQKGYTVAGRVKIDEHKDIRVEAADTLGGEQGAEVDRRARGIMGQGTLLEAVTRGHWHPHPKG